VNKVSLDKVANFYNGRAFKPEEWQTRGLPIIRIQNLTGSSDEINYFDGAYDERNLVRRGDILISWSASLGVYIWQKQDALLNQHIFKVELKDSIHKNYFYHAATYLLNEMKSHVHGSTMQHITKDRFDILKIPLSNPEEQKRIAAILDKADRLRRQRRFAQTLSDSFLQSVFIKMFGDPVANPMNWSSCQIGDAVSYSEYGTSEKSNQLQRGYPVLGMSNLTNSGELDLSSLSYVELAAKEFRKLKLESGDIIFNRTNSTELVGKTASWNSQIDAVLASYLVKLKLKRDTQPDYFVRLLNMPFYKRLFQERCKKAVGQSNISPTLLKEFPMIVPPLPLQEKFAAIVQKFERIRRQQREATRQAEHLFQTLLHRAFSGQL